MVWEKWQAAAELQTAMLAGGASASPIALTEKAVRHYRRKVAANSRRLA
jgi:hypothetical protein